MRNLRSSMTARGRSEEEVPGVARIGKTLKAVPREQATLEAEGGESVLGDVNRDGMLEHMHISGDSHAQGGVPLDLDPGNFIFSDSKDLRIKDAGTLDRFTKSTNGKKGYTPAQVAKQYDINSHMQTLQSDSADALAKRTAQLMLDNNTRKLAELALVQEEMKGLPNGVPAVTQQLAPELAEQYGAQMGGMPLPEEGMEEPMMAFGGELEQFQGGGDGPIKMRTQHTTNAPGKPKPKSTKLAKDTATGYWNRASQKQEVADPRAKQALEKIIPFYGQDSDGVLDYLNTVLTAPQKEINHLLTGFYESPMTTVSRYSEMDGTARVLGDIASDPMIVGSLAGKAGVTGARTTGQIISKVAPKVAQAATKAAEITSRYGSKVAKQLAPYIDKIPMSQLMLIGNKLYTSAAHAGENGAPLTTQQINELARPLDNNFFNRKYPAVAAAAAKPATRVAPVNPTPVVSTAARSDTTGLGRLPAAAQRYQQSAPVAAAPAPTPVNVVQQQAPRPAPAAVRPQPRPAPAQHRAAAPTRPAAARPAAAAPAAQISEAEAYFNSL